MICRQLEAWNKFIRGRIAQEQGREEDALREFEQALEIDPDDQCFRDATKVTQRKEARGRLCRTFSFPIAAMMQ
jgi:tetratricopeptide (TPR) repeat protein